MENTTLIEQTAKNIKLAESVVLAVLFASNPSEIYYSENRQAVIN